jgi:tetratricopeptide (TPR) repeat protein
VLAGPPGIGKTRLAIEYAHENHTAYNTQIKLPIDTKANLHSAIVNLSTDPRLAVTFQPLADRDLIYQIVLAQLASLCADGLLLILDGANSQESVSVVRDFLKLLGAAHVIVTSQIRKWGIGFEVVEVTPLTVAGAASFLFNGMQASRITQSDAEQLAQELGCVPLAIEIALAYCDENLCRASEYLDLLKKKTDEILQFKEMYGTVEYPFSLWAALAAAWDRVVEIDPWANTILVISAFYGQAPIPLFFWEYEEIVAECSKFLVDLRATTAFQTLMAAYGQPQPRKSIAILQRYCHVDLSTEDGLECYSVPSLIRTALRGRYAKDSLSLAIMLTQPLNALQKHLLIDEQSPSTWTVWSFLRPHVESVLSDLVNSKFVWPTVLLAERLGSWYSACGFNQRAIAILSQVYSMEVEAWGSGPSDWQELAMFGEPDHATIFVMHSCTFSRVLLKGSSISEAKAVLQMCEQLLPRVGPRLQARWYAHTGDCLFAEGEISDAGKMYTEAIEIEGKLNESQNGLTMGVYLQKRASTQIAMSEFEKAESIIRESIQICAKWRFTRHRATVVGSDLTNSRVLSSVYLEDDWQITSDQDRRVMFSVPRWLGGGYGRFTPELAHVLSTFGDLRVAQDRLDEARLLFDGSLAICWYSFGPLASLTAEVWAKRKVISTDGEQFADSYPDWVCGMIVTEIQLISNGVRRRRARRG